MKKIFVFPFVMMAAMSLAECNTPSKPAGTPPNSVIRIHKRTTASCNKLRRHFSRRLFACGE